MAYSSSVPQLTFTQAGITVPSEADILAGVQDDMNTAFGGGLNPNLETPQGQLASSTTAVIGDKNNEILNLVNMFDPRYSSGRYQDALGYLYFLIRKPALPTTVTCTLIGVNGTVIPAGTLAQDTSGNTYQSTSSVTIGVSGAVSATFQNVKTGAIACPAGTLNIIYQAIAGWDTINNLGDGVIGNDVESQADFEARRAASVAANSHSSVNSIYGAVFNVANVTDVYIYENFTNKPIFVGSTSYPINPHSIYVAVVGGTDAAVANAIWTKKDIGCDMNGNTTVQVTDTSGYNSPYPTYNITFNRPTDLTVKFDVKILNSAGLPVGVVSSIKTAIINRFYGNSSAQKERIGGLILSSNYYTPIQAISPLIQIIDINIGTISAAFDQILVGIDQRPMTDNASITVTLV